MKWAFNLALMAVSLGFCDVLEKLIFDTTGLAVLCG